MKTVVLSCAPADDRPHRPGVSFVDVEPGGLVEAAERAAKDGALVLCDYPSTVADVKAVMRACDGAGVRLAFAAPARHGAAFATVRQGIADGVVGTLSTVHGSYHVRPSGTGALGGAAHLLDLVDAVLGGEPARQVYAQTNEVLSGRSGVESAALVTVRYRNGMVASFDCSDSTSPSAPVVTFIGDKASVEYNSAPRLLGGFDAVAGRARREPGGTDLYSVLLDDFLSAEKNSIDGAAALRVARIVEAAYESARTGQTVEVSEG